MFEQVQKPVRASHMLHQNEPWMLINETNTTFGEKQKEYQYFIFSFNAAFNRKYSLEGLGFRFADILQDPEGGRIKIVFRAACGSDSYKVSYSKPHNNRPSGFKITVRKEMFSESIANRLARCVDVTSNHNISRLEVNGQSANLFISLPSAR